MKIILNKEEQEMITEYFNSNYIKTIEFETSNIYIRKIAKMIAGLMGDISRTARVGYVYNSKNGKLLFKNDFQRINNICFDELLGDEISE